MITNVGCATTDAIDCAKPNVTFVTWHGVISVSHGDTVTDMIADVIRCHLRIYLGIHNMGHSQAALDSPATGIRTSGQASSLSPLRTASHQTGSLSGYPLHRTVESPE